jgi:DNA repair and recombination protein RAD52
MAFSTDQLKELQAPLSASNVRKNPKGFDYVEGWHAIAEANRIFGFDGWDRQMIRLEQVAEPYKVGDNMRVAYRAVVQVRVFLGERVIVRDGTGYGSGIGRDLNDAHESAIKEAETDAMKRALMTFGNPFGLALYDKTRANVEGAEPAPQSSPREPAARVRQSLVVTAALTAITSCETQEELSAWLTMNEGGFPAIDPGDLKVIEKAYGVRFAALAPFRAGASNGVSGRNPNGSAAVQ